MKIFSLQYNFLRPSPYDLKTEENDANFLPYQRKKAHHVTYQKFLNYKEPENYLFFTSIYTSPFTFNSDYLKDHTKIKGKLRNCDPLKQSFLFLPNENPKRPIIVPQEYLILNDDSLLQEDIPQSISKYTSSPSTHKLPTPWRLRKILLSCHSKKGIFK